MEHAIGFPALGLEFVIDRIAFSVLGHKVYWYGIIICIGFVLGALYMSRCAKRIGFTSDHVIDCLLICVPTGIICARIYFVAFEWEYYRTRLSEIVAIWNGGIAVYGSIIGVLIGLFAYSRVKKLSFVGMCDVAAPGLLIGQCIGRWGNFVNAEAYGGVTALPWGMTIDGSAPVHPAFLYESIWTFVGFLLLHHFVKKRSFAGEIALMYVFWYGLGRAWIEGLRTDSLYFGTLRVSQVLAVISCVVAAFVLARKYHQIRVARAFYTPPASAPPAQDALAADAPTTEPSAQRAPAANTSESIDNKEEPTDERD